MSLENIDRTARIAELAIANDLFRITLSSPRGRVIMTQGVARSNNCEKILKSVQNFRQFSPDDNPFGERDFGAFELDGVQYFWKIDYYDETLQFGVDPYEADPFRVLTIMRADEY
jgi:hypothetical protein